jgi:hypothetical protein
MLQGCLCIGGSAFTKASPKVRRDDRAACGAAHNPPAPRRARPRAEAGGPWPAIPSPQGRTAESRSAAGLRRPARAGPAPRPRAHRPGGTAVTQIMPGSFAPHPASGRPRPWPPPTGPDHCPVRRPVGPDHCAGFGTRTAHRSRPPAGRRARTIGRTPIRRPARAECGTGLAATSAAARLRRGRIRLRRVFGEGGGPERTNQGPGACMHSPPLLIYSAPGGLRQDPSRGP